MLTRHEKILMRKSPGIDAGNIDALQEQLQQLLNTKKQLRQQVQELEQQSLLGMKRKNAVEEKNAWLKSEFDYWKNVQSEHSQQDEPQREQEKTQKSKASRPAITALELENDDSSCEAEFDWSPTGLHVDHSKKHASNQVPLKDKHDTNQGFVDPMDKDEPEKMTKQTVSAIHCRENSQGFRAYTCPVEGCNKTVYFDINQNLPLNNDGTISDQVSWLNMGDYGQQKANHMREHMKKAHETVPETMFPPAFTNTPKTQQQQEIVATSSFRSGYQSETEEEEFI